MDAANKDVDPADEEAKGGSGMVGKMLLSSGERQLALLCYVPVEKKDKVKHNTHTRTYARTHTGI